MTVLIRPARPEDVEAIRSAHRRSIVELASKDYPDEVLAEWGTDSSFDARERHREALRSGSELSWVAIENDSVIGFSSLIPATGELRAVYVVGSASSRGVGRSLLKALESKARELGLTRLSFHGTVTARAFSERNGYRNLGPASHRLGSGREMKCFAFDKEL